ncbi:hypothetical protein Ac2012v2_8334 [Leucoagaricus gongylophorus]
MNSLPQSPHTDLSFFHGGNRYRQPPKVPPPTQLPSLMIPSLCPYPTSGIGEQTNQRMLPSSGFFSSKPTPWLQPYLKALTPQEVIEHYLFFYSQDLRQRSRPSV